MGYVKHQIEQKLAIIRCVSSDKIRFNSNDGKVEFSGVPQNTVETFIGKGYHNSKVWSARWQWEAEANWTPFFVCTSLAVHYKPIIPRKQFRLCFCNVIIPLEITVLKTVSIKLYFNMITNVKQYLHLIAPLILLSIVWRVEKMYGTWTGTILNALSCCNLHK